LEEGLQLVTNHSSKQNFGTLCLHNHAFCVTWHDCSQTTCATQACLPRNNETFFFQRKFQWGKSYFLGNLESFMNSSVILYSTSFEAGKEHVIHLLATAHVVFLVWKIIAIAWSQRCLQQCLALPAKMPIAFCITFPGM